MKHPVLTRVFAIVLVIMCIIMLLSGIKGYGDTVKQHEENIAYGDRLEERIKTYKELDEKLANSISYDEAFEELEAFQEQHDTDASQHKTDLATYSASKGGYTMAVNAINEAKAELADAKAALEAGKQQLAAAEAGLPQSVGGLTMMASGCSSAATGASGLSSQMSGAIAAIGSQPLPPTEVTDPDPEDPDYSTKLAEYNQYLTDKNTYDTVTLPTWEATAAGVASTIDVNAIAAGLAGINQAMTSANDLIAMMMPLLPESTTNSLQSASSAVSPLSPPSIDAASMTGNEVAAALSAFKAELDGATGTLNALSADCGTVAAALPGAIADKKSALIYGEQEIKKGEQTIQANLENIWYKLGQLEEDEAELSDDRERLLDQAGQLEKMILSTNEMKALEDKRNSTRILLTNVDEIETMVDEGGELVQSAETFLAQHRSNSQRLYTGRLVICVLALICGVAGFVGIPSAFEKTKKRFWLIAPVLLCLLCAAGADGVNMYLGLGQMYAALFTAILALVQTLIILPKNKKIPGTGNDL